MFRYPGIRSDSDMYTLGYAFKPWTSAKAIADGPSIRAYGEDTATERGIDRLIRFGHRVVAADWSSAESEWRVNAETADGTAQFRCRFLVMAAGYYDYDEAFRPRLSGEERFAGCDYLIRLLKRMDGTGARVAIARRDPSVDEIPFLDFTSGYVRRALLLLP